MLRGDGASRRRSRSVHVHVHGPARRDVVFHERQASAQTSVEHAERQKTKEGKGVIIADAVGIGDEQDASVKDIVFLVEIWEALVGWVTRIPTAYNSSS